MFCILFLERLGLFHCLRKHEGFIFPWGSALCMCWEWESLGWGWQVLGRVWWLLWALSAPPLPLFFGAVALQNCTQGIHHGSAFWWLLCGNFSQVDQRISTFFWDAWWPNWSHWAAWSEQSWGDPRHFHVVHVWGFSPQAPGFPLRLHLWTLPSYRAQFMGLGKPGKGRCPQWGLLGFRERAGDIGKLNWAFRKHPQKVCAVRASVLQECKFIFLPAACYYLRPWNAQCRLVWL